MVKLSAVQIKALKNANKALNKCSELGLIFWYDGNGAFCAYNGKNVGNIREDRMLVKERRFYDDIEHYVFNIKQDMQCDMSPTLTFDIVKESEVR